INELIFLLTKQYPYVSILLNATPQDLPKAESISIKFPCNVKILKYSHEVLNFCALVKQADAVISPDTAIIHIAAAFDRPVVGLYKNSIEHCIEWGPEHSKSIIVMPDGKQEIYTITPQKVFNAFIELNDRYKIV
ncbi:MAG: hypothetical protein HYZ54_09435, partial [Ignavibacteriae bacterium]|nr:hypothetical protein [Ignavibacteriota bacterium]